MGKYTAIAKKVLKNIRIDNNEVDSSKTISPSTINVESRKAYKLFSEIISDFFWVVTNADDEKRLRAQGITAAIYTNQDILELGEVAKENLPEVLKAVHMAKKEFTYIKIQEITRTKKTN